MMWRKQSSVPRPRIEETWLGPKPPLVTLSDSWPNLRCAADRVVNKAMARDLAESRVQLWTRLAEMAQAEYQRHLEAEQSMQSGDGSG